MNKNPANPLESDPNDDRVNWMFLDLNSFFASCEQQMHPELRGKPVAVVPGMVDTTCCIAASYEAKAFGVKTGTLVGDAKKMCPGIILIEARHRPYVEFHHAIIKAFETVLPVDQVMSIDEFAAPLIGRQREPAAALELARQAKAAIARDVGACLTSSIGIAPNRFLAKVASDMQKPNGLTLIRRRDLPHCLHRLQLRDICGIGPGMETRLHNVGITTMEELCAAPPYLLKAAWGGVGGLRFHAYLHGADIDYPQTQTRCIGHQHVLEPELRTPEGAHNYLRYLLMKTAQRLREKGFYARQLSIQVKWMRPGWNAPDDGVRREDFSLQFAETQSTVKLLKYLTNIWQQVPKRKPLRIGVLLSDLIPAHSHQPDLFEVQEGKQGEIQQEKLLHSLDHINQRYGTGTIGFGVIKKSFVGPSAKGGALDSKISFSRVPALSEFGQYGRDNRALAAIIGS